MTPEIDALKAARAAEQASLDAMVVVGTAEGTVAEARVEELQVQQLAARRRWSASKGRLTKAQRDGAAGKVVAARIAVEQAYAEFDRISGAVIDEASRINLARLDELGSTLQQMHRTWDAGSAVIEALARPDRRAPE